MKRLGKVESQTSYKPTEQRTNTGCIKPVKDRVPAEVQREEDRGRLGATCTPVIVKTLYVCVFFFFTDTNANRSSVARQKNTVCPLDSEKIY